MFGLIERWAALEPQWCRLGEQKISFGPKGDDDWIEWDWEFLPWRESGSLQMAVIEAIDARNWSWTRNSDGTITVGSPAALHSIIISGRNFTLDLLNAYVQRLEMEVNLLTTE
ncbi:MAG: hypothetical protein AAF564_23565 [Bacteroidota bacterium]